MAGWQLREKPQNKSAYHSKTAYIICISRFFNIYIFRLPEKMIHQYNNVVIFWGADLVQPYFFCIVSIS